MHNIASCLHHLGELEAAQVRAQEAPVSSHPAPLALPAAPAAVQPCEAGRAPGEKASCYPTPPPPLLTLPCSPHPDQAYYEQAIQAFEKAKTPFLERMMYALQWLGRP